VAFTGWLTAVRKGRLEEAARYLELGARPAAEGPKLARRLKAVLDRRAWVDVERLSPLSAGAPDDGLDPGLDELAQLPVEGGPSATDPVRMARHPDAPYWRFTAATVDRVDAWYEGLEDRWILDNLPEPLARPGPWDILWWQWLALVALVPLALMVGRVLGWLSTRLARRLASRTEVTWDDALVEMLGAPFSLGWALVLSWLALPLLVLNLHAQAVLLSGLKAVGVGAVAWALWRSIDVVASAVLSNEWSTRHPTSRALVPLGSRSAKVALASLSAISALSLLGFPVASLLAGLGIGGLALALAGQKTVENLFGAFSLGIDQPIREGDWVKVEELEGTVESIGLRSTRIRTNARTLVSLPNGRLADMRLENFTERDRMLFTTVVGLTYGTSAAQVRAIVQEVEAQLRAHPLAWQDTVVVALKQLGASSLELEVLAWLKTSDNAAFRAARQDLLLGIMETVERGGSAFAFPTQTVHLVRAPGSPGEDGKP
jgi:MscS family membrane protein